MITEKNGQFVLETRGTTYAFRATPSGHLEHQYYGAKIDMAGGEEALSQRTVVPGGNGISYSPEYPRVCLEDLCVEMSSVGHGDVRSPFVEIVAADGSGSLDFRYREHRIRKGKTPLGTLPSAYAEDEGDAEELHVLLADSRLMLTLELVYAVFADCDAITRSAVLKNESGETVTVTRLASLMLDFDDSRYRFHTFTGSWAREMNRQEFALRQGRIVNESRCGISSSMNNPFVMLSRPETGEDAGFCLGLNLIYSGSHREEAEVNAYGKTRILTGIQPDGFAWELAPGEELEAPEAVMVCSEEGFTGMSRRMHAFVREHIVRGYWKRRERPVLLNSWEAMYFDFDEEKLLALAAQAKEAGVELFVMDDGWFGGRDDSTSSLGDWQANRRKLPGGVAGIARKVEALGLAFGLWVEPEMICVKSRLYEEHPDWAVDIPGAPHSEGRSQRILDLTRPEVRTWLVNTMSEVFGAGVSYVKWDNNRIFTDFYGKALTNQGEFLHRYYLGYYEVMGELVRRFPKILFEGCASGGNRFDLGVLCYMPQIWASDNTDAICRAQIQTGYSYGYPMSVVSAHVSASPNHQTLRRTPWGTRFGVAAFGVLGYELDPAKLTEEEFLEMKEQIAFYKAHRRTLQYGDYYRLACGRTNDFEKGVWQWMTVAADGSEAVGFFLQEQVTPNMTFGKFQTKGLNTRARYHFTDWQAGICGKEEDFTVSGSLLNHAGIRLAQASTAFRTPEGTRAFPDFAGRVYEMERIGESSPDGPALAGEVG